MPIKRAVAVLTILALTVLVLGGCAGQQPAAKPAAPAPAPAKESTLVQSYGSDPTTLNPLLAADDASSMVVNQIFNALVTVDNDLNVIPDLAEKWDISQDGKTYTFYLRKGVKWHDGKPFSSADVKFTFDLYKKEKLPQSTAFDAVQEILTPDENTVVFKLSRPEPTIMLLGLAFWRGNRIVPKHIFEGKDLFNNEYNMKPIGTGPWKFKEWVKGDRTVLERNESYFRPGLPKIDRYVFKVIPSPATEIAALEKGETDYISNVGLADVRRVEKIKGIKVKPTLDKLGLTYYLGLNRENKYLKDIRVRKALMHAMNRQEVIDIALEGLGKPQNSFISSALTKWYNPNVPVYEFDSKKAASILDGAGYKPGVGGMRFTVKALMRAGRADQQKVLQVIQSQWKKVGVGLEIVPMEQATINDKILKTFDFDMVIFGSASGPDADRLYSYFHAKNLGAAWQFMRYNNAEVNRLWDQSRQTMDDAERRKLFNRIQEIIMSELPFLPVYEYSMYLAVNEKLVGLPAGAHGYQNSNENVSWTK